jgi:PPM family protein phosphatase
MLPEPGSPTAFQTAMISEAGGRGSNQDSCKWLHCHQYSCWALADGLGGHSGGEIAASAAVEAVLKAFSKAPECSRNALQLYFDAAQKSLQRPQQDNAELVRMRTTLVTLVTDAKRACWGHLGDSRLYRFQSCAVTACTEDHSVPQALVAAGEITSEAIRGHTDRGRLLRSLGGLGAARPTLLEKATELGWGDVFLLCTDGFWENVLESEMLADLEATASPEQWLKRLQSRLLKRVSGTHDNYSAIAVFCGPRT